MYHTIRKFVFTDSQCEGGESTKSFEDLFAKLDVNKDGKVDVSELKTGLAAMGFSMGKGEAQVNPVQQKLPLHFFSLDRFHYTAKTYLYIVYDINNM